MAAAGSVDASQWQALQDLRCRIRERTGHPRFHDVMLLRFLRARDFDVAAAWAMFSEHLDWRHSVGIDCESGLSSTAELDSASLTCIQHYYPHGFHGTDREGRPVYIERLGKANLPELLKTVTLEEMMQYFIRDTERTMTHRFLACSMASGRVVDKSVTILDLGGVGMNKSVWTILSQRTQMLQSHFPDTLGQMLIINAPKTFSWTWSMVKSMLDPRTVHKIKIFSGGQTQQEALEALADPANLPSFLAGECTCGEGGDKGPWLDPDIACKLANTPHWELWNLFAPAEPSVDLPPSLHPVHPKNSHAEGESNGVQAPKGSPLEECAVPTPDPAGDAASAQLAVSTDCGEKYGRMPKKPKVHCPPAIWKRQQKILDDAYARIMQDALARLPHSQRNSWRSEVKAYFDRIVSLYRSKAIAEELAAKFHDVMDEHARLKQELKHAEGKLLSLRYQPNQSPSDSTDNHTGPQDASDDVLRQSSRVSMLTNCVMDAQANRDRLHFEFRHELDKLSKNRSIVHSMRQRHPRCCCGPLDAKIRAYIQLQEALSDTLADLEFEQVTCTSSSQTKCGDPIDVIPISDGTQGCLEKMCCIEDLGTMSDTASFYSCDEGEKSCASAAFP